MPASIIHRKRFSGARAAMLAAPAVLLLAGCNPGLAPGPDASAGSERLRSGTAEPRETRGAPYPAAPRQTRAPRHEEQDTASIPTGPRVGEMRPANPATQVTPVPDSVHRGLVRTVAYRRGEPPPLVFPAYRELTVGNTPECCGEVSVAETGSTTLMTGNWWMALSENGGADFTSIDPTTIFPEVDGGFCCDQVVVYAPGIDMFVWLLQYKPDEISNRNRIRLAAQTTDEVRGSHGTAWTYWDFPSDVFNPNMPVDRNDMAVGDNSLCGTPRSSVADAWWCASP